MVDFESAPQDFADAVVRHLGQEDARRGLLIRDVFGRLMFVTKQKFSIEKSGSLSEDLISSGNSYFDHSLSPIATVDKMTFDKVFSEPSYKVRISGALGEEIRLIDRKLVGDNWLTAPCTLSSDPKILVFYSIKGGVGRSTALAVTAARLAEEGKNVLAIDFDLEAPALGNLLLDENNKPTYGVVDWFAAVAAGADSSSLIPDMIGSSSFTSSQSVVNVVPCLGTRDGSYLSKLARAYTPGSAGTYLARANFATKARHLINELKIRRSYDVVLVDARAGLHETSGSLLLGLGARSLCFGIDTSQNFDGYKLLLSALAATFSPDLENEDLRGSFKMVHAKAPQDTVQRSNFITESWKAWSETLYDDESSCEADTGISIDNFVFDIGDETAPHFPLEIIGNDAYTRFEPRQKRYLLEQTTYQPIFGNFLAGIKTILDFQQ